MHSVDDLHKEGSNLLKQWLIEQKKSGTVSRLGVSVYSAEDINGINNDLLNVIQLPLSIYDQRLLKDGTIEELKMRGVEIHARSIYLQGLILEEAKNWPSWVKSSTKEHHKKFEEFCIRNDKRKIEFAIEFVKAQELIDAVTIGIAKKEDLIEILGLWSQPTQIRKDINWYNWSLGDTGILDPRLWPKSE